MADNSQREPAPITILHVSDMQFGYKHLFGRLGLADPADAKFDTLFARLRDDLRVLKQYHDLVPNLLVVSGDLAEWGLKSEFEHALAFVTQLTALLDLPRRQVILVPGNHDINRKTCEAYFNECAGDESKPVAPFWPKWKYYHWLFQEFYLGEDERVFAQDQPYTWWDIPELKIAVAGFNSTMAEIHDEDKRFPKCGHFGNCGESQLRWFAERLQNATADGLFRLGVIHHNVVRGPENDNENLRDVDDFKRLVVPSLNLVLHGHTHFGALNWLDRDVPAISTGSSGLDKSVRPEEVPCQYQVLRVFADKIIRSARAYSPSDKRWIGDTSCSQSGNAWQSEIPVTFRGAHAVFTTKPHAPTAPTRRLHPTEVEVEFDRSPSGDRFGAIEPRRHDFLDDVAEVYRLREPDAHLVEVRGDESGFDYLRVTTRVGPITRHYPVAAIQSIEQPNAAENVQRFGDTIDACFRSGDARMVSEIVYGGLPVEPSLIDLAWRSGVKLMSFAEYEGLINFAPYVKEQSERLRRDPVYPPRLYVPQRFIHHNGNQQTPGDDVIGQIYKWLAQPDARFLMVLGDFGTGKTFLLHEVARRMPQLLPNLTPVLIEMRALEKGHPLDVLVSMHMIGTGEERFDVGKFRHMMRHGRVCLLFDGFDELALRLTYDRAAEHLETLVDAARGNAKVMVTSRSQHFLSEQQVKQALYAKIENAAVPRIVELMPFDVGQVREFLVHAFQAAAEQAGEPIDRADAEQRADRRLAIICNVEDLQGLSANPRMLSFIAELEERQLLEARDPRGKVTAADLYALILDRWLDGEVQRRTAPGGLTTLEKDHLWTAVTKLALRMWQTGARAVGLAELADEVKAAIKDIRALNMSAEQAAFEIGSGSLLVRGRDGQFSFVHRSVMEWLVARAAAAEVKLGKAPATLQQNEISKLMADFLIGLAGFAVASDWSRKALDAGAGEENHVLKKNALLVHQRIEQLAKQSGQEAEFVAPAAKPLNFANEDLRGHDFANEDLRGAIFHGADLTEAIFTAADLRGAELTGATLVRANLARADLRGADLRGAVLAGANLLSADLRQIKLAGPPTHPLSNWRRAKLLAAKTSDDFVTACDLHGAARPDSSPAPVWAAVRSEVYAVAFSSGGDVVASGHDDGTLRLWDAEGGKELRVLRGHMGAVGSVVFRADGKILASAGHDKSVRLWDAETGMEICVLQGHTDLVRGVAFRADGLILASASDDKSVRLWDAEDGKQLRVLQGHTRVVTSVAFRADGKILASASDDQSVRLWDAEDGKQLRVLQGHNGTVMSLAFRPDGKMLASASSDNSVRLWDVEARKQLRVLQGHTGYVRSLAFRADGKILASVSYDQSVRLWDAEDGKELRVLQGHNGAVRSVAFRADRKILASASDDNSVRLWDAEVGKELRVLKGHTSYVMSVAFRADGKILASASADKSVRLWDAEDGKELRVLKGHTSTVWSVAFRADGKILASASADNSVRLWDAEDGKELRVLQGHNGAVRSVAFRADGKILASAGDDGTIRYWEVETGRLLATLISLDDGWAAVRPDGKYKLVGNPAGRFWWVAGQCRFEPGELDPHVPEIQQLPLDAPLW